MQAGNILEDLPCSCVVFDQTGTITYANRTLCKLVGYPAHQIHQRNLETILTVSSRIFYQTHFFPLLEFNEQVSEIFLTLKISDGSTVPVMANANVLQHGEQTLYTCVFSPVWERQKYEQQLLEINRQQQKALSENAELNQLKEKLELNQFELDRKLSMLHARSTDYVQLSKVLMHDMQEPIRKISLFYNSLVNEGEALRGMQDPQALNVISKSIERLKFLTGSLLDFVQVTSFEDPVTILCTKELIGEAYQQLLDQQTLPSINLTMEGLPSFEGRKVQLQRVFLELLKNSAENKHPDRALTVNVKAVVTKENAYQNHLSKYKYTDHVRIEFSDNGTGFDESFQNYVFGLLNKLTSDPRKAGLGLTLCKQIVSHHFGTIKLKSVVGQGTTVIMLLPLLHTPEYVPG